MIFLFFAKMPQVSFVMSDWLLKLDPQSVLSAAENGDCKFTCMVPDGS